ncbi:hypothetical protein L083_4072 [Actinoplanes sp. N902-109]|nr:hypothetical protein L083_4072 [Actinoplanes sp. N902-109]
MEGIFGYAQQLFTKFVDKRAHAILDDVGRSAMNAARVA